MRGLDERMGTGNGSKGGEWQSMRAGRLASFGSVGLSIGWRTRVVRVAHLMVDSSVAIFLDRLNWSNRLWTFVVESVIPLLIDD